MSKLILLLGLFQVFVGFSQPGQITITPENLGTSQFPNVLFLEDNEHALNLEEVISMDDSQFESKDVLVPNFDFTASKYWLKFSITNTTEDSYFILETARPITNKVNFYQLRGIFIENQFRSGDDYHYSEKIIPHRKNLFPVSIDPGETKDYIIEIESDGEVLILPVRIYDKIAFFANDYKHQFSFGFYYGLMCLVIVIYFFFYVMLKDKSFLFYILYVFCQALMQFSLDGFSFHHFFPNGGYMANHFILLIAGTTVIILLRYVSEFLQLSERFPTMQKVFIGSQILVGIGITLSLIPGPTYQIAYPVINGTSLIGIILSVTAIYILLFKGKSVDRYFTIAFTILIIGAVIFILGNFSVIGDAELAQTALKISSAIEVAILSISMSNKYRKLQRDKEEAQAVAMQNLMEKNALMDDINAKLESQVKQRTAEISEQKEQLAEQNKEIMDSIRYAKRIQEAILPTDLHVREILPNSLILYLPKDVVSGDFYFIDKTTTSTDNTDLKLFAAVDCTGHGVPGAFMSIVGSNLLKQTLTEKAVNSPAQALDFLNKGVNEALHQDVNKETTVRDGMDIAMCALDEKAMKVYFSGAKNPLYIIRQAESTEDLGFEWNDDDRSLMKHDEKSLYLKEIKSDIQPIGAYVHQFLKSFTNHEIDVRKGDMLYVFSDGFADQFGGENGKKYKYKNFKKLLLSIAELPVKDQQKILLDEFYSWKGDHEQLDDVLIIGVRV